MDMGACVALSVRDGRYRARNLSANRAGGAWRDAPFAGGLSRDVLVLLPDNHVARVATKW
jgi:hypothetical protein